jgi:predicted RND superfamily exporter protein
MSDAKQGPFHKFAKTYVQATYRHPWISLGVLALVTLVMGLLGSQIRIRSDLRLLLPSDAPSVTALELSEKRMGSTDFFTIAFEDSSAEKVGLFQKALAESLSTWKESQWVQYDEDRRFFERHALLYLPADQLEDLEARLNSMAQGAKDFNPLTLDLMADEPAAPANLDGWPERLSLYKQGIPMDVVEGLLERLEKESGSKAESVAEGGKAPAPSLPDTLKHRMIGWHSEKGKWVGVVMAQLRIPSTEASFATVAKEYGERTSLAVQQALGIQIHSSVVGAYRDPSSEIEEINGDMWVSTIVAVVLILGLLLYYMRKPANVAVVFVPLVVAMVWMMGSAQLVYGRLTVLTSFVLALLSGIGIEYGIHIYSRWMEERRKGLAVDAAMEQSLAKTGRSLVSAMGASITCMLALQIGHFEGFKEFGIVVSMGIFLAFLSSMLVLPPVLFVLLRVNKRFGANGSKLVGWITPSEEYAEGAVLVPKWTWSGTTLRVCGLIALVVTLFMLVSPRVEFENDFKNLRGGKGRFEWISSRVSALTKDAKVEAAKKDRISYGRAVGKGKNTTPSLVMANSEAQMREIHDTLGARFGGEADTMLKSFVTIQSFVPAKEMQLERLEILSRIRKLLDSDAFAKADDAQKAKLSTLRRFTVCDSFGFDSLPPYARRFMTETDGSHGKFGFIYAEMRESDAVESRKFQDRNGQFTTSTGIVPVASSGFIYADVVQMVKDDVGRLAIAVFLFLAFIVWFDTRSWRGMLVNMGYVGLIAIWTYGAMGWLGLKLGMFNIVVLPALLSNTVDATIHLYHRRMEAGAGKIGEIYNTAGSSVLAGTLTNAFGFLALIVVAHQGLNTIGMLACLGYAAGILIMFLAMPFLLEVVCPKEPQAAHDD